MRKSRIMALAILWLIGCSSPLQVDSGAPEDTTPVDTVQIDTPPPGCPTGQSECGGNCVDTQTSNSHCGRCDNPCPTDQVCTAGTCSTTTPCPTGQARCSGTCVDTVTDRANCGSCGNACATDENCVAGSCGRTVMCPSGQTACAGTCVDTNSDTNHCGACGHVCGAGETCTAGTCRPITMCPAGQTSCSGTCVDLSVNLANCGSCGTACATGERCIAGACSAMACPSGQTNCGGTCVTTATDVGNCGGCGRVCAPGQTCAAGACVAATTCATGLTLCSGICVDTRTSPSHCGTCSTVCTTGQICQSGVCVVDPAACPTGQTRCGTTCVDTNTSALNCGACGWVCPRGQTCVGGTCACGTGLTMCARMCVNTATSATNCGGCGFVCPTGQVCAGSVCACPSGQIACGTPPVCVTASTDPLNCGACGTVCAAGQSCVAGACVCPTGQIPCGTPPVCIDPTNNRNNCGRCGNACSGGMTCVASACVCPTGQTNCGGRCVDVSTDPLNCGRCAMACPPSTACAAGACTGTAPPNDTRAGATVISLTTPTSNLAADTRTARNDTTNPACGCTSGQDVFYRFTLTQPEYVYADTIGATWDTSLLLQDSTGANLTTAGTSGGAVCNDDNGLGCATGTQSMILARLAAGTYYLVLSGCGSGTATIHFQHLPAGNGAANHVSPGTTVQSASGTTSGTGTTSAPSCCSGGAEASYWWVSCPGTTAAQFYASTCGGATWDTEIEQRSAIRTTTSLCNDDVGSGFACGLRSALNTTIPAGTGLNAFYVDACSGAGAYAVNYSLRTCATGLTNCGNCVNTQTDDANCGGCNRACPTSQYCNAGVCTNRPANDTRAGATVLSVSGPIVLGVGDTTHARNDTTGSCGCTSGNDVFFRFTLTAEEIVYADTIGATWDTSLFFQDSSGANIASARLPNGQTCNDDNGLSGCSTGRQSQIAAALNAGTYYLVLSGCGAGVAGIHVQHLRVGGDGSITYVPNGTANVFAGTTGTSGTIADSCCVGIGAGEDTYYWYTCQDAPAGSFAGITCPGGTSIVFQSAILGISYCNWNVVTPCSSTLNAPTPSGPGLHAAYVKGCNAPVAPYSFTISRAP